MNRGRSRVRRPFEPLDGTARWRKLYELLTPLAEDEVIDYDVLATRLDLDPVKDRHEIQMAMRRAAQELSTVNNRSIESIRNVGYRVVRASEHVDLSRLQQRRSGRALSRAKQHVDHVDFSKLSEEGKAIVLAVGRALSWQQETMRRFDVRQKNLEDLTSSIQSKGEQTAEETAENAERIAALERRLAEFEASK